MTAPRRSGRAGGAAAARPARLAAFAAVLAGCAAPPAASPASSGAAFPVVQVGAGRADTLDAAALGGATLGSHPDVGVRPLGDGRVVVAPRAGWSGAALVPAGAGDVVAVAAPPGGLRLRLVGPDAEDPSLVEFAVARDGGGPVLLDEEEGVVALVGDRPYGDNAIDAFQDYVFLDLDDAGAGRRTVRLAVRDGGEVSNWLAVEVEDGRFARAVRPRIVGR